MRRRTEAAVAMVVAMVGREGGVCVWGGGVRTMVNGPQPACQSAPQLTRSAPRRSISLSCPLAHLGRAAAAAAGQPRTRRAAGVLVSGRACACVRACPGGTDEAGKIAPAWCRAGICRAWFSGCARGVD